MVEKFLYSLNELMKDSKPGSKKVTRYDWGYNRFFIPHFLCNNCWHGILVHEGKEYANEYCGDLMNAWQEYKDMEGWIMDLIEVFENLYSSIYAETGISKPIVKIVLKPSVYDIIYRKFVLKKHDYKPLDWVTPNSMTYSGIINIEKDVSMDNKKYEKCQENRKQRDGLIKLKSELAKKDHHITSISVTVSDHPKAIGGIVQSVSPGLIPVISKTILKSLDDEIAKLDKEFEKL